jgi:hypothetical protein
MLISKTGTGANTSIEEYTWVDMGYHGLSPSAFREEFVKVFVYSVKITACASFLLPKDWR